VSVQQAKSGYLSDLNSLSSFLARIQASLEFFLFSCAHLRQPGAIKRYLLPEAFLQCPRSLDGRRQAGSAQEYRFAFVSG
jgi:hypothetical protein